MRSPVCLLHQVQQLQQPGDAAVLDGGLLEGVLEGAAFSLREPLNPKKCHFLTSPKSSGYLKTLLNITTLFFYLQGL